MKYSSRVSKVHWVGVKSLFASILINMYSLLYLFVSVTVLYVALLCYCCNEHKVAEHVC